MKFSDGQSEFSRVFNFAILGYSRNSRKLDARENIVFYSIAVSFYRCPFCHSANNEGLCVYKGLLLTKYSC